MSTCSMKCTPPRRSSPRYMGWAPRAESQAGVRGTRFSATINIGSVGSVMSAFSMASLALSCSSGVANRARTELPSSPRVSGVTPAACKAASTCFKVLRSTLRVALAEDTCTAGASPKKLGRVKITPISNAIPKIAYFQNG